MPDTPPELGIVVRGSLAEGLEMRLHGERAVEELRAGKFVIVQGEAFRFFSMVTDVALGAVDDRFLHNPPGPEQAYKRRVLAGTSTFGVVKLRPMLMLARDAPDAYSEDSLLPVKTIPPHFSPVVEADAADVDRVFGSERDGRFFTIGAPLDMEDTPVCLNLERFVERSNGVFGKSGTGKTFLTRICLCGIIRRRAAVNLIFDMHGEYGWKGTVEQEGRADVRALRQLFGSDVQVYTLDRESSRRRKAPVDREVRIPYSQITAEDILLLAGELNLSATAHETAYLVEQEYGDRWLSSLLDMDAEQLHAFAERSGAHPASLAALRRKLSRFAGECRAFLVPDLAAADDAVPALLDCLRSGKHVVLEFGQYNKPIQYMLVANVLTRRIHAEYVRATEKAMGEANGKPRPLVITIEEAHKFLAPGLSAQTIFGTIAREMRKYNVTLLIVYQRPSGIDDEILSQIGTKLVCLLDDDKDAAAVLTGTPNAAGLRAVLASLETKQQALLLGHALPMPVVVRTRTYDDEPFRRSLGVEAPEDLAVRMAAARSGDFAE